MEPPLSNAPTSAARWAIVTGGSIRGGLAISRQLHQRGLGVVVHHSGTASAELVLTASFPSCPFASLPQQYTWVSCPRAQLWNSPTLMATAGEGTDTKMGLAESPATLPSWN